MLNSLKFRSQLNALPLFGAIKSRILQITSTTDPIVPDVQTRGYKHMIKYGKESGERESCLEIVKRYTRLHWGGWIRAKKGQGKQWKKTGRHRWQSKQFTFVSKKNAFDFDILTNTYHRSRRYYPDDPLKYYHQRNFRGVNLKPLPCTADMPPALITKKQMENNWYASMNLVPETDYKRPVHYNYCLQRNYEQLRKRLLLAQSYMESPST